MMEQDAKIATCMNPARPEAPLSPFLSSVTRVLIGNHHCSSWSGRAVRMGPHARFRLRGFLQKCFCNS